MGTPNAMGYRTQQTHLRVITHFTNLYLTQIDKLPLVNAHKSVASFDNNRWLTVELHGSRKGNEAQKLSTRAFCVHTMEPEMKEKNSSQAAYKSPENHPSNTALWHLLFYGSSRPMHC